MATKRTYYRGSNGNAGPFTTLVEVDAARTRLRVDHSDIPDDEWAETASEMLVAEAFDVDLWVTTAPEGYDGFGTFTVGGVALPADAPSDARVVAIEPRRVEWQTLRYGSGLCGATPLEVP